MRTSPDARSTNRRRLPPKADTVVTVAPLAERIEAGREVLELAAEISFDPIQSALMAVYGLAEAPVVRRKADADETTKPNVTV